MARGTRDAAKLSRLLHFAVVKRHDGKNLGNGLLLFFPSFTALYSGPEESTSILLPPPPLCGAKCMRQSLHATPSAHKDSCQILQSLKQQHLVSPSNT